MILSSLADFDSSLIFHAHSLPRSLSGATTQEIEQHENRNGDSQSPKQYPAYLTFFIVQHNVPPFLEPRIHIRTDEPCHYVSKYSKLFHVRRMGIIPSVEIYPVGLTVQIRPVIGIKTCFIF